MIPQLYIALAIAAGSLLVGFGAGHRWVSGDLAKAERNIEILRGKFEAERTKLLEANQRESERARTAELALGRKVEDEALKGRAAALAMDRERAAGSAALRSVRDRHGAQLAAAAGQASGAASAAVGGAADPPRPDAVLAELWSAAEEAVVLAGWLDRAIDRGLRCERLYNAARQQAMTAAGQVTP